MAASCCNNTAPQLRHPYCSYVLCLGGDERCGSFLADWRHAWGVEGCAIPLHSLYERGYAVPSTHWCVCDGDKGRDYGP